MPVDPGLLYTNVPVYAINLDARQHAAAKALVNAARDPVTTLYVTSQVLCEFYSVITNPRRVAVVCSPSDALRIISVLLAMPGLHVLPSPASAVSGWMSLLWRRMVTGAGVYDLQLAATILANGIHRIYTFNATDFQMFSELTVVRP